MFLRNNSTKIIGIGEMSILPGETEKCPEGYEKNPVIQRYIKNGTFTEVKGYGSEKSDIAGAAVKNDSDQEKPLEKSLEKMTEDELLRYAVENGIDTGKATTKEGILKKIQDVMS